MAREITQTFPWMRARARYRFSSRCQTATSFSDRRKRSDASIVEFGYRTFDRFPTRFSLSERRLDAAPARDQRLREPQTELGPLKVVDWKDSLTPKLNGIPLALRKYEMSQCAALAPAGD